MYQKVLVPLDGSELAECALPHILNLKRGGGVGEVILLNVVDIPSTLLMEGIDFLAVENAQVARGEEYLGKLSSRLKEDGLDVRTRVLTGKAAETIIQYSKAEGVDLIVIGTHGYTGMKQLMFGSVALRVLHDAHVPVLLIRSASRK